MHAARERLCDITREYDCIRYSALGRLFSRFSLPEQSKLTVQSLRLICVFNSQTNLGCDKIPLDNELSLIGWISDTRSQGCRFAELGKVPGS